MRVVDRAALPVALALLATGPAVSARAVPQQPSGLSAFHRDGQSFLTWGEVPGGAVTYRVYRSSAPIAAPSESTLIGEVDQNTTLNARAQQAEGAAYAYRIVPGADLPLDSGLFVHTTAETGAFYYAVTSVDSTGENTAVTPGQNATASALPETLNVPQPVLQRTVTPGNGRTYDIYAHWTSDTGTTLYPRMCVVPSKAFSFMVMRRGTGATHPLLVSFHAYGGNYYGSPGNPITGTGYSEEWVLSPDDVLENDIRSSFWYGYHDGFDWYTGQPVPTTGTDVDYTQRRAVYALDWALAHLPVDPTRIYFSGWSMGGFGATFIGHAQRDRVAARLAYVPKLDLSYLTEVNPDANFNPGAGHRVYSDRRWGTVETNLPCSDGCPVYDRLNYAVQVSATPAEGLPHATFFAGRNDITVGWGEKIAPVDAMLAAKQPFVFFWDSRTHGGTDSLVEWSPIQYWTSWLYDYRLDESLPAFSNCSADGEMGDGDPTTADQYGTVNGYLEWKSPPSDEAYAWSVVVEPRDLTSIFGTEFAPDTITVDVTPRRLQVFAIAPGLLHPWEVRNAATGELLSSGLSMPDANGLVTVPGVLVTDSGARVTIYGAASGVESAGSRVRSGLRLFPNPGRRAPSIELVLSRDARVGLEVLDVSGRRVASTPPVLRCIGTHVLAPEEAGLTSHEAMGPGVYFYRVTGPDADAVDGARAERFVLVR